MDFDDAKENIQPLAAGRNASILQAALNAESHQELQQQRRQYEESIKHYEGEDPLEPWFEYIYWIEQSFPSGGKESGLEEVLLKCLTMFEKDERYHQDRRMIKLYIKYIDTHENPQECYQQLYNQGIGTMVADLYICWAYYYDLCSNFRKADQIFRRGIECRAQPIEELQEAHQHFGFTMSQRILYDDDSSKQKYQSSLQEKRQALTSLKSHKKKVGSIRTGAAVKSYAPGKVQQSGPFPNTNARCSNVNVRVFEDENQDPNAVPPLDPVPDTPVAVKSVVKTILDSARKQENAKEPGPWNKAHDKKKGILFSSGHRSELGFEILEDEEDFQPIKGIVNYGKPFVFFDGFVNRNKPQEEWILPVTLENELVPRSYPTYDKCLLYPQPNMEHSPEELRGYYWFKRNNIENAFVKKYDTFWKPDLNAGMRMYPNFAKKNQPTKEEPRTTVFDPSEVNVPGKSKLVFDPKICYPSNDEELQLEEVMYHRWKTGERKLKYGGNETIAITEEMEETMCLPKEAARRKSFFPSRKSVAPSQFAKLPTNLEELEEEDSPKQPPSRRSVIVKTPKKAERDEQPPPKVPIQIYEDEAQGSGFAFKTPATPPVKQQKLQFQIYEEEESNYEGNETCSTQVFNCFIKAQSVSTPKAPVKVMKPFAAEQHLPTNLNFSGIENVPPSSTNSNINPTSAFSPPEYNDAGLTMHGKQLSTIMETSEHATVNTGSTKSSISSAEFEVDGQQTRIPLTSNVCTLPTLQESGTLPESNDKEVQLMKSLRLEEDMPTVRQHNEISRLEQREDTVPTMPAIKIFEDKTETVPKMLFTKAGNFSRLEDKEDTTPNIKPVRFQDDKTETITKMILAPKKTAINDIPTDDEMLDFFAKSPEKKAPGKSTVTPPLAPAANKSIFTESAFMNFQDSPVAKLKCNYDSPELRSKTTSLKGLQLKPSNLSFLPNFDEPMDVAMGEKNKTIETSFLPNMSGPSGHLKRQKSRNDSISDGILSGPTSRSVLQQQSGDNSFLPGFPKETTGTAALTKQKSTENSFLSGFPSVTVGANKPREDSFMSYLSSVGAPQGKKAAEDSFVQKFSSGGFGDKANEASYKDKNPSEPMMKASFVGGDGKAGGQMSFLLNASAAGQKKQNDSFLPSFGTTQAPKGSGDASMFGLKNTDDRCKPNLSTFGAPSKNDNIADSFMANSSPSKAAHEQMKVEDSLRTANADNMVMEDTPGRGVSRISKPSKDSIACSFSVPQESLRKSSKISFLAQPKDLPVPQETAAEHSFKFSFSKSPQQLNRGGEERSQNVSKIPHLLRGTDNKQQKMNQSQSSSTSTFSFLNSFSVPEAMKPPEPAQKFAIFEDSNCQKTAPLCEAKPTNQFTIFEDSTCQRKSSVPAVNKNKSEYCDTSLRPDDFFEDNIRTEAFSTNLSMIRNSTWLPNHGPRQSQIKEQSLHIKEEMNISSKTGLSIFSSVPQEKSVDLMPPPPPVKPSIASQHPIYSPTDDCIEIAESDEENNEDLGKSIYYTKTPKTPKVARHTWVPDLDEQTPETNIFIHREVDLDHTQQVIDDYCVAEDVNPFNRQLIDAFLCQIEFTNYIEKLPTCSMVRRVKPLNKDCTVEINGKTFNVMKLIGEGAYGSVYCANEPQSGKMFALKQERPANLWEYYICLELRSRLTAEEILPGFQDIEYALIGNNAGILVSSFSRYGSLINVCNKIKKETLKNIDEYVVMHIVSQLLLIMDHLHASNIIHADVKPDNFLLMEKLVPGRKQPTIQLIDFGTSIDMDLFKKGQTFTFIHETESFKCVEMHKKRPWTYQLDLFGLAGVIHVLLFGKYMEIVQKPAGWTHKTHVPRYFNRSLWETIFHSLLNIDDCQTMPNLQNLRAQLREEMAEKDKAVCQKIVEFNRALDL